MRTHSLVALFALITLFASPASFAMGKRKPGPQPSPSPTPTASPTPSPTPVPPPPKPTIALEQGIYHDSSTTADPSSCSIQLRISMNAQTVYLTHVTNNQSEYYCSKEGDTSRYDLVLTPENEWKLMDSSGVEIVQIDSREFGMTEGDKNTTFFQRVADKPTRPKHFPQHGGNGWSDWTGYGHNGLCIMKNGAQISCDSINEEIILRDGICEEARNFVTDLAIEKCKGAGYSRCNVREIKTRIYVRSVSPSGSYPASGCEARVMVDGV